MKLDRALIDKDGAPTVKETQEYFKKDYTTAPLPIGFGGVFWLPHFCARAYACLAEQAGLPETSEASFEG